MSTLSPDQVAAGESALDLALAMPEAERAIWLASLHRVLAHEKFLEEGPQIPSSRGLAGQAIGTYRLISQIEQGGMGSVWLAERNDGRFERRVAVKFLSVSLMGKLGEERFKREGSILGRLAHPHIAELIDAGVWQAGQPYLVLGTLHLVQASLEPGTLSSVVGRAYLTLGRALQALGKLEQARTAFRSAAQNLQNTAGPDRPDTRSAQQLSEALNR